MEGDFHRTVTCPSPTRYNLNDPSPRINQFRVFDFNDDDPQLDVAQLVIQRAISEPKQFGFRFDLIAGSGVPEVTAAYGLFRDMRTGVAHHLDIPQLFISYIAPVGKGLRFDLGKFAPIMGYEVIGGYDGYNDNFSRSFSFGYGSPIYPYRRCGATYSFSRRLRQWFQVTNGWDDVQRLNHAYTVGTQLALTPDENDQHFCQLHPRARAPAGYSRPAQRLRIGRDTGSRSRSLPWAVMDSMATKRMASL